MPTNNTQLPANGRVPRSRAQYVNPAAQNLYERYGVNPPYIRRTPYASENAFIAVNPDGTTTRFDLMGFPSRYPLALSATARQPTQLINAVMGRLPHGRVYSVPRAAARPAGGPARQTTTEQPPAAQTQQPTERQPQPTDNSTSTYIGLDTLDGSPTLGANRVVTGTAPQLRHDSSTLTGNVVPDEAPAPGTLEARYNASMDAINDIMNYYYNTGQRMTYAREIPRSPGVVTGTRVLDAINYAAGQGANRSAFLAQQQYDAAQVDAYRRALAQQTGRSN